MDPQRFSLYKKATVRSTSSHEILLAMKSNLAEDLQSLLMKMKVSLQVVLLVVEGVESQYPLLRSPIDDVIHYNRSFFYELEYALHQSILDDPIDPAVAASDTSHSQLDFKKFSRHVKKKNCLLLVLRLCAAALGLAYSSARMRRAEFSSSRGENPVRKVLRLSDRLCYELTYNWTNGRIWLALILFWAILVQLRLFFAIDDEFKIVLKVRRCYGCKNENL